MGPHVDPGLLRGRILPDAVVVHLVREPGLAGVGVEGELAAARPGAERQDDEQVGLLRQPDQPVQVRLCGLVDGEGRRLGEGSGVGQGHDVGAHGRQLVEILLAVRHAHRVGAEKVLVHVAGHARIAAALGDGGAAQMRARLVAPEVDLAVDAGRGVRCRRGGRCHGRRSDEGQADEQERGDSGHDEPIVPRREGMAVAWTGSVRRLPGNAGTPHIEARPRTVEDGGAATRRECTADFKPP